MLSSVIARFATHASLSVTRRAAPAVTDGVATPGATSIVTLTNPCVQPADGANLKTAPEGHRLEDLLVIYTPTRLLATAGRPDTISIDWPVGDTPQTYAVVKVEGPWMLRGSTHYRAWVARQVTP
jgi:hypothetical protein